MKKTIFIALISLHTMAEASVGYYANETLKLESVTVGEQTYQQVLLQRKEAGTWALKSWASIEDNITNEPTAVWHASERRLSISALDAKIGATWFYYENIQLQMNETGQFILTDLTPSPVKAHIYSRDCSPYEGVTLTCGYLVAPFNHQQADSRAVHLAFTRIKSTRATPQPDPVVYLSGGPGSSSLPILPQFAQSPYLKERDIILLDPRGLGLSEPNIACPEVDATLQELAGQQLPIEKQIALHLQSVSACQQRLSTAVVDELSLFNSQQNAGDLNALRLALSIEQWNLLGVSYGTRWALTAMRDYPEGIRSVILDSPVPLQVNLSSRTIGSIKNAFDLVFTACENDETCHAQIPNLKQRFFQLVEKLDKTPELFYFDNNGTPAQLLLTGQIAINVFLSALYDKAMIPIIPFLIKLTDEGQASLFAEYLYRFQNFSSGLNRGVQYSTLCREDIGFDDEQAYLNQMTGDGFDALILAQNPFGICKVWSAGKADKIENQAVKSDIPTLILTGEFDPVTPPAFGELLTADLSNSHLFNLTAVGHASVFTDACGLDVSVAFLNQPTAEKISGSECVAELSAPTFVFSLLQLSAMLR